jgi:hypothetical protein
VSKLPSGEDSVIRGCEAVQFRVISGYTVSRLTGNKSSFSTL